MITDAAMGTYCDHCKIAWGRLKDKTWHPRAQKQALVVAVSSNGQTRAYCKECLDGITQGWGKDGSESWTLQEQMRMAASLNLKSLRVRLSEVARV
tara:strand:+ start:1226 stop:1513 length:288 start_codon:yes stop_codon:yes gene_type:complete